MNEPSIFFAWSTEQSRKIAEEFKCLFDNVFAPTIKSFMSSKDIRAGAKSINLLFNKLEECNYGICFINEENVKAPWILFEAGALSKKVNDSNVVVLVLDEHSIDAMDGTPLEQFQHKLLTEEGVRSIFEEIIKSFGQINDKDIFMDRFNREWGNFDRECQKILAEGRTKSKEIKKDTYNDREELDVIKKMLVNVQNLLKTEYSQNIKDSVVLLNELKKLVYAMGPEDLKAMRMQFKVQKYEIVLQENIRKIQELMEYLEIDNSDDHIYNIDKIKEKLNDILVKTLALLGD